MWLCVLLTTIAIRDMFIMLDACGLVIGLRVAWKRKDGIGKVTTAGLLCGLG